MDEIVKGGAVRLPYKTHWEWLNNELAEEAQYMEKEGYSNTASKIRDALALLKEQEAVEPHIVGSGESFETAETWWYECGNCNKPIYPDDKFCRHCGRAVKWE